MTWLTLRILLALSVTGLFAPPCAFAQEPRFTGLYAVGSEFAWTGDQVVIDLTIQLTNEGPRPALNALVTIEPVEDPLSPPDGTGTFARLKTVDLHPGESIRLVARVTLPAEEWTRWQQRSETPVFRVAFHDDVDGDIVGPLRLAPVGVIPEQP
jgi:hypothetical protein